jgi:hypothetical protein
MGVRRLAATLLAAAALSGCAGPQPAIIEGDADSVEIRYAGDVERTMLPAKQHCARFARVARLRDPGLDVAVFDCVRP